MTFKDTFNSIGEYAEYWISRLLETLPVLSDKEEIGMAIKEVSGGVILGTSVTVFVVLLALAAVCAVEYFTERRNDDPCHPGRVLVKRKRSFRWELEEADAV